MITCSKDAMVKCIRTRRGESERGEWLLAVIVDEKNKGNSYKHCL